MSQNFVEWAKQQPNFIGSTCGGSGLRLWFIKKAAWQPSGFQIHANYAGGSSVLNYQDATACLDFWQDNNINPDMVKAALAYIASVS